MAGSAAYVLPSKPRPEFVETFGIALVEKMLAGGGPVITTDTGGIGEAVGDCALIVPVESPAAIADVAGPRPRDVPRRARRLGDPRPPARPAVRPRRRARRDPRPRGACDAGADAGGVSSSDAPGVVGPERPRRRLPRALATSARPAARSSVSERTVEVPPVTDARSPIPMAPTEPLIFVLHGARGDLAKRMVLPALAALQRRGLLPERWALLGTGRTRSARRSSTSCCATRSRSSVTTRPPRASRS